jgi:SAM-dependent methyltransferase
MTNPLDLLRTPNTDPTSIYRYRDGLYAADLLTAAISHFDFFTWLGEHSSDLAGICQGLQIQPRPTDVMLTLFTAMGLIRSSDGVFSLTDRAEEHLVKSSPWHIGPYFDSTKERPVCLDMVTVLRTGKPANWASLKNEKKWSKAMETDAFAKQFTAAMDARGVYLGPAMANQLDCANHRHLLDIAGGSGIYSCVMVARHAHLRATVFEKSPVDQITARSLAARGFAERIHVHTGDMFTDPYPTGCDIHLISNVLHDWDVDRVEQLLRKSYMALPPGGMIVIHDAHINAEKTGPLPVAAYSALLMTITEGKCYSVKEMEDFLKGVGFSGVRYFPTAADRSVMVARR